MRVLRLKILQPTAHYRIPFTFARRHTYPIPPYSTIIGLICNVLGIENQTDENFEKLKNGLSLAIYGKYESLNREYVWYRNLNKEAHKSRFSFPENRIIDQMPEHPGGQIPTRIDVLENIRLLIYIKHSDEKLLEEMKNALENPQKRIYPIHLGRAEDLVIFETIDIVELKNEKNLLYGKVKNYDFTWLVDSERGRKYLDTVLNCEAYREFFNKVQGSYHLITSFYKIVEGIRVFEHIPVKLFEGGSFPFHFGKPFEFVCDEDIPLFFAKMVYPEV
uniref:Type I-B CRISPR-associated protein Cas5 n=1 Tax=candidate division WOR-3 bacterium TaxID=2052148 RepID=A0A7V1EI12_UNCW3